MEPRCSRGILRSVLESGTGDIAVGCYMISESIPLHFRKRYKMIVINR